MDSGQRPQILCVDDDPLVLLAEEKTLGREFNVTTAPSAEEGLVSLELDGPFAVIVTDMNMPGMDGVAFLSRARQIAPDTTRVLLTGEHDLSVAIQAVNEGSIFRFLSKPCPINQLTAAIKTAAEQYRLITSERVLLEQTLRGCVKALTEVLALASPITFGRALRARTYADELASHFAVKDRWQLDVAAMLSQIGCITLPMATTEKMYNNLPLSVEETAKIRELPAVVRQLLGDIPRFEPVVEAIAYQDKHFNGAGFPRDSVRGEAIPWAARVLKLVLDYDALEAVGFDAALAIGTLQGRVGSYDPVLLEAFAQLRGNPIIHQRMREVTVGELRAGTTFASDVRTHSGALLIARGQEVSSSLIQRLRNLPKWTIVEPLVIVEAVPGVDSAAARGASTLA